MKRFDRVRCIRSALDESSNIIIEIGTTGFVLGVVADSSYDGGFAVLVKLDEPIYSKALGLISMQDLSIVMLEVIDGDS